LQVRRTSRGENVILDEDDNVIKVLRNSRSPTPPSVVGHRRVGFRSREPRTLYYETPDGRIVTHPPGQKTKKHVLSKTKSQVIYPDDEPTRVIRKVIIDPRTGDRDTIYEKDKPKKQQKVIIRQRAAEIAVDSDYEEEQSNYVRVVRQRADVAPERETTTKYIMVKNRDDHSEPVYSVVSSSDAPVKSNHRVVYQVPSKKASSTYVYSSGEKYYK
jgi:hypothetical protein